jgi:hypothetical protein
MVWPVGRTAVAFGGPSALRRALAAVLTALDRALGMALCRTFRRALCLTFWRLRAALGARCLGTPLAAAAAAALALRRGARRAFGVTVDWGGSFSDRLSFPFQPRDLLAAGQAADRGEELAIVRLCQREGLAGAAST